MNNQEMELNFDVNIFECYKAFKYKYTKSNLTKLKLKIAMSVPIIISLIILMIKVLYNFFEEEEILNINFQKTIIVLIIIYFFWIIIIYILYKRRIHILATLENEKHMEDKISYKSKIILGKEFMSVNSEVFYGRIFYKGIQDIIVFKDIIVILVKPVKILIIPISAFENLESRKNFINILSEKTK